jgi:tetratricopeptide (TPR) repeat protein
MAESLNPGATAVPAVVLPATLPSLLSAWASSRPAPPGVVINGPARAPTPIDDETINEYRAALRLEPDNADARSRLASALNSRAWTLATDADPQKRDPGRAIKLASEAVELDPKSADGWNTLGVAQYRAGNWKEAISSLEKYRELRTNDAEWNNPFFLAVAHRQLGNNAEALQWYEKGATWMDRKAATSVSLMAARREAAELLGVNDPRTQNPSSQRSSVTSLPD